MAVYATPCIVYIASPAVFIFDITENNKYDAKRTANLV